jgi:hypothetical protein
MGGVARGRAREGECRQGAAISDSTAILFRDTADGGPGSVTVSKEARRGNCYRYGTSAARVINAKQRMRVEAVVRSRSMRF